MGTTEVTGGAPEPVSPTYDEKHPVAEQSAAHTMQSLKSLESPGVSRIKAISSVLTLTDRIFIFFGIFLIAYCYGLDGTLRYTYQNYATGEFGESGSQALISSVNVIRAVIGAATQPTAGKVADVFGRVELILASIVFYIVGTIVLATSANVATFAAGTAIYQIGYTMITLLVEILVADITSTRARLFFSYIPALPFIINTWASGYIATSVLAGTTVHWGYAMWCIIYPVCCLPLIVTLWLVSRRAKKMGLLPDYKSAFQRLGMGNFLVQLFWLLDVPGIILVIAVFDLILVPFTLAASNGWKSASVIAPLVIGFCCIPVFIIWELRAPHPLVPFRLMKDRGVWAALGIALMLNFVWYMQGDYLYNMLIVAFDFDINMATRVSSLYSFCSVIVGPIMGLVVFKIRRLKYVILAGTALFMVAFGLLIHFRSHTEGSNAKVGVIAAEVLLGVAGGMFPYPAQASLQVQLKHENLAVMTGIYLATYNIGSALGNAVSGAIYTQVLPGYLSEQLTNQTLAVEVYGYPAGIAPLYAMDTPERQGMVHAFGQTQRLLCITGIALCTLLIGFAFALRNPVLTDAQTLAKDSDSETDAEVPVSETKA
ncbi:hypothetical protein V2G26_021272 [Clonostachys chloroleuca]|uniref:Major facilitator superfamily (MFS) profile domain-containing protein n=1 Tax=Clonostachys chloroleuca TaxID=1926264 RepID=A0AA35LR66_9HYPO|nr:unnamed protein product [Clonostachys chloroleuca]